MSAYAGQDQFNALAGQLITRARVPANSSMLTGGVLNQDASVDGSDFITVEGDLGPTATAAGDLTVQVFPFAMDGVTVLSTPLPAVANVGYAGTLVAAHSQLVQQFNVQGIDKVRVVWKNNNAGTLPFNGGWKEESI